jgi:hypothetical protein
MRSNWEDVLHLPSPENIEPEDNIFEDFVQGVACEEMSLSSFSWTPRSIPI